MHKSVVHIWKMVPILVVHNHMPVVLIWKMVHILVVYISVGGAYKLWLRQWCTLCTGAHWCTVCTAQLVQVHTFWWLTAVTPSDHFLRRSLTLPFLRQQ